MLQSKFHRPWQPRVSGSQPYNPSAQATESEVSFSTAIEEVERDGTPESEASQGGVSTESAQGVELMSPEAPVAPRSWYSRLVERFAKH
jgi:hypothetical protein